MTFKSYSSLSQLDFLSLTQTGHKKDFKYYYWFAKTPSCFRKNLPGLTDNTSASVKIVKQVLF